MSIELCTLFAVICTIMCIHPKTNLLSMSNCLDKFGRSTLSSSLFDDLADPCCYIDSIKELNADSNDLIVTHLNIRSLSNKLVGLSNLLQDTSSDVCLLNETWLNDRNKALCQFDDYELESVERSCRKGGGVGILISKTLNYKRLPELEIKSSCLESCVIKLKPSRGKSVIIASWYRPPNSNCNEFKSIFNRFLNKICGEKKNYIIGMDHNFDFLKFGKHDGTQNLLELILDHGLLPTITLPTRITKSSATLIDNIFVSKNLFRNYTSVVLVDDLSDHLPCIFVSREAKVLRTPISPIYCQKITPKTL